MEKKLKELQDKLQASRLGGGREKIEQQHQKGKLTARERISLLLDEGSFEEIDMFLVQGCYNLVADQEEFLGDGVVTGCGTINGRLVYVASQDFTVMGGSLGEMHARRIVYAQELAVKNGVPFIQINDSGGARIQEGVASLEGYGEIFKLNTLASGVIPQISIILGPCAGGAVYSPGITDFVFMVDTVSHMFITGPDVTKTVTGEEVTSEQLGGAAAHSTRSGVAHFFFRTEKECLSRVRELLEYLPSNNVEDSPEKEATDSPFREDESLLAVVPEDPQKIFDIKDIIHAVVDNGEFMEVHALFAGNLVVGFARLNGKAVGIVANQPSVLAGCLDIDASDKGARFIRFCDAFNIPLVTIVDVPGFLPGVSQEHSGIIRHGAKMLYAYAEASVPKISLIVRKAYGGAYVCMCSKKLGTDLVLAWPQAEIAVMGPEGAVNIAYRREISESKNPEKAREERVRQYRERSANPYVAARYGFVDSVIDPRKTRYHLIQALKMLHRKREDRPRKKHGNIPL
ncbi:MAG: methylmalonyl-CoA carboxyltransferase [Theionarchaea archaeon]|nr:methylmalonyl-CoA carboxyltransferase [Theionarchaea archaeon]MBU7000890.1 methylmalonyl-CoA carboxyltransferase [Theionarchaea archaeon]MBU7041334.1 methylmalonyl-CoA carboxyltransferase [Theionarchaea archaeon]